MSERKTAVPPKILAKLRAICLPLPGAVEEVAWVGIRWSVRKRTFAHVLTIDKGWPPAYARAAASDGPVTVLTFRSAGPLYDALAAQGPPFFQPRWSTTWSTRVIGIALGNKTDWKQVAAVVTDSYRLLAPKKPRPRAT